MMNTTPAKETAFQTLLRVPTLAPLIADTVEKFAETKGLKSFLWYHGDPWWFVRQEVIPNQFFREVHIAAFAAADRSYLVFMPQVCRFFPNAPQKVARPTKWIRRPLDDFPTAPHEYTRKQLEETLIEAWRQAENLTVSE